jgi:NAD(P)-dependent dehydrogenase (short-subunit alcohol dehydrogenase family)
MGNISFDFGGATVLVTGAARGIGLAIATRLAAEGARVLLADTDDPAAARAAAEIGSQGGQAVAHRLDVTSPESWAAAVARARDLWGRLDILVNNAGIGLVGSLTETGPEDFARVMAVNVAGVYNCSHAAVGLMLAQQPKGGAIVNIASIAGQVAVARRFAYGASKGAVISMTQSIALDYVDQGIRCNCICPGTVETPFVEAYLQKYHAGEVEETRTQLHARQPLGRMGRPEEIAPLALYLASDEAAYVTGAQMVIDGGLTAR